MFWRDKHVICPDIMMMASLGGFSPLNRVSMRKEVRILFSPPLLFLRQRIFFTAVLMGNLLKHIQHPPNFDLRSVPQPVTSQTNVSQNPALVLCLLFLPVLCTCDYPWGIGAVCPLWQYPAPGLCDWTMVCYRSDGSRSAHSQSPPTNIMQYQRATSIGSACTNLYLGSMYSFSLGNFTHLIKAHLKCQWFY